MEISYLDYRQSFLFAAMGANATIPSTFKLQEYKGPEDEDLTCDVAIVGASDASKTVIVSSGIHGVELPFGSIMQRQWLDMAAQLCKHNKGVRFVFVHALNPFGSAYDLRTDHHNIDGNRNFVDFNNRPETSADYIALKNAFSPPDVDPLTMAIAWTKMIGFKLAPWTNNFEQALAGGQYNFADGLYYGGNAPSWTRQTWEAIVKNHVVSPYLENLWHIDIHTGYGPYGKLQILVNTERNSALHDRARNLADEQNVKLTSEFFAKISGDITDFWPSLVPQHCVVTPMAIEVGTLAGIRILHRMIKRNTLRSYGDDHPDKEKIMRAMRNAFYPQDGAWQESAEREAQFFWNHLVRQVVPNVN